MAPLASLAGAGIPRLSFRRERAPQGCHSRGGGHPKVVIPAEAGAPKVVIPAEAGTPKVVIPAEAGTPKVVIPAEAGIPKVVIPAEAGIQSFRCLEVKCGSSGSLPPRG
jgi:hypothetical protein